MSYSLTTEDRLYILANRPRLKIKELSSILKVPQGTVKSVIRRAKEAKLPGKWKTVDHAAIISTYINEGLSKKETGKKYGLSEAGVTCILRFNHIPIRDMVDSHRHYDVNAEAFKTIDTPEKAYWLGFLYADGYVHTSRGEVKLQLAAKDHGHLVKYRQFLQSDIPIKPDVQANKAGNPAFKLTVYNRKFTKHLIAKGCTQAKSFTITFPPWLDSKFFGAFILGLLDGDGSVGVYKSKRSCCVQLLGTQAVIQAIHDILLQKGVLLSAKRIHKDKRCPKIHTVKLHAIDEIYNLYNFLYFNSPVWLDRKKAKFEEFFKLRNRNP